MLKKTIKLALVWTVLCCLIFTQTAFAKEEKISAYQNPVHISVNGTYMDAPNHYINETLYVPLRAVTEGFGYKIIWNEDRSIDLTANKIQEPKLNKMEYETLPEPKVGSFMIYADELTIRINGQVVETPHYLYKGTTYVPLVFFRDVLNCHIYEDSSIGVVKIYAPDYITFGEGEVFYYDGQMLTKNQYDQIFALVSHLTGNTELSPNALENELQYLKSSLLLGEKITNDDNFKLFLESNNIDAMLKELNISDPEFVKEMILKPIFYQYEINDKNATAYYIPTDAELEAIHKKSPYAIGHWMKAKHILIMKTEDDSGKKQAEEILKKLKNNPEEFDKLMAEKSEDPGSHSQPDGYLFTEGQMVTEFYEGTLALEVGEISEIVESQYGYHIILKVADYSEGVPYTEVKDELHISYAQEQFRNDLQKTIANINTILNSEYSKQ